MAEQDRKMDADTKIPFEEALDQTGFGVYSYMLTAVTGLAIISFACVAYSSTIIVPSSACELGTTSSQQGALASAPIIGSIIGAFMWGYLGDTRGRRNMLLVALMLAVVFNSLASISVNWIMLMIIQFFACIMSSGKYTLSVTLLSECVPFARRNLVMLLVASIFLMSQGVMAALAIPVIPLSFSNYLSSLDIYWNSWRTLILIYSLPSILCAIIVFFFVHESPKYLLLKNEEAKALDVLRSIHRMNKGKSVGEFKIKGILPESKIQATSSAKDQFLPLFRPPLIKFTVIMATLFVFEQVGSFVVWLPTIANQFVQIVQTGNGTDLTMCGIIEAAIEAPEDPNATPCALNETALLIVLVVAVSQSLFNLCVSLIVNYTGRRNMVIGLTSIIGLSGIVTNFVPNAYGSAVFFCIYLLGIMVLGLYSAMTVALFPTHVRAMAVSLTVASGRIGTFASVQILNFLLRTNCEAGFYSFAAMIGASAIIAAFLPDDRKIKTAGQNEPEKAKTVSTDL